VEVDRSAQAVKSPATRTLDSATLGTAARFIPEARANEKTETKIDQFTGDSDG
jgi:hypothetical protein